MSCPHIKDIDFDKLKAEFTSSYEANLLTIISNPATSHKASFYCLDVIALH